MIGNFNIEIHGNVHTYIWYNFHSRSLLYLCACADIFDDIPLGGPVFTGLPFGAFTELISPGENHRVKYKCFRPVYSGHFRYTSPF